MLSMTSDWPNKLVFKEHVWQELKSIITSILDPTKACYCPVALVHSQSLNHVKLLSSLCLKLSFPMY